MEIEQLRSWFLENKRDLPWRDSPTPYNVWISEVMLQQTQSSRVILYFSKWMQRFPTIKALAESSQEEVLKYWEGLGYYSRARSLHAAANEILTRFNGVIPDDKEALLSIIGLGPYTVGAILAFGYHKKEAAVDANVVRVLTRYFAIPDDVQKQNTQKKLFALAASHLPEYAPWEITEALIELGALVCNKTGHCSKCPLQQGCQSAHKESRTQFPVKARKVQYEALYREVMVIVSDKGRLLVRQGASGKACAGLYEFPYFEVGVEGLQLEEIMQLMDKECGLQIEFRDYFDDEQHSYTRFRVTLYPKLFYAKEKELPGYFWHTKDAANGLAFNSGHKRVLLKAIELF